MKSFFAIIAFTCVSWGAASQELFVFSEPASNMPARSMSVKLTEHFVRNDQRYNRAAHRLMPELMVGVNKNLMLHFGITMANMHTSDFRFESSLFYAKYRFLSKDEIHKHFRMAAFAEITNSENAYHYEEGSMMGDKDAIEIGIIATQLWNKFALSATLGHTQDISSSRWNKILYIPPRIYQFMNFSLSAGLLVLPKEYTDYKQTNLNLYLEFLGQQGFERNRYWVDMAPALQLIFNSNAKLNLGYRFQLGGNMTRMSENSWLISFERTFLNVFKAKAKKEN